MLQGSLLTIYLSFDSYGMPVFGAVVNALVLISEVARHCTWLLVGWVTV